MKFVVFGDDAKLGLWRDGRILDLCSAAEMVGISLESFRSLLSLIEAGGRGLDVVRTLDEKWSGDPSAPPWIDGSAVQLHPPFPGKRLALAGSNFPAHVANAYTNFGQPITAEEVIRNTRKGRPGGFWMNSPPVGTGARIPVPRSANGLFDYEGELAIVLGKGGKRIRADRWADHVWGVTLIIDWSIRPPTITGGPMPFYGHKSFDASKSMGPCIAVDEVDPANCDVQTLVNDEVRQDFSSADMMHSYGEILEQLSGDLTLFPGDMLSGGTGPGTAFDSSLPRADGTCPTDRMAKAGDAVEVRSNKIGSLVARVVDSD